MTCAIKKRGQTPFFQPEQPLPAYSGVTVWAFHPLRVVTGETSVKAAEYSTPKIGWDTIEGA